MNTLQKPKTASQSLQEAKDFVDENLPILCQDLIERAEGSRTSIYATKFFMLVEILGGVAPVGGVSQSLAESLIRTAALRFVVKASNEAEA